MSLPTVDRWREDGMPVVRAGSNGKGYEFDLEACRAWRLEQDRAAEKAEAEKQERIRQFQAQLDLEGGEAEGEDALPFKARKEFYAAEWERMRVARERGKLVEASDVRQINGKVFAFLSDRLQSLPDYLERVCGMTPDQVGAVAAAVDEWQDQLADDLEQTIRHDLPAEAAE